MSVTCPSGHASEDTDYCSVCGARIDGAGAAAPVAERACPSCGEPRAEPDARYCEVCRFDFQERRPGPPPVVRAAPHAVPVLIPVAAPISVRTSGRAWELIVEVDPSLDTEPDPASPCPRDAPRVVVPLDQPDLLVGRHDETRAIHPEIPLDDPGASRRHARFVIEPDGVIALQDLASTNGTQVNGEDVPPGTRRRLGDGDMVTLGRWTRITLQSKA